MKRCEMCVQADFAEYNLNMGSGRKLRGKWTCCNRFIKRQNSNVWNFDMRKKVLVVLVHLRIWNLVACDLHAHFKNAC